MSLDVLDASGPVWLVLREGRKGGDNSQQEESTVEKLRWRTASGGPERIIVCEGKSVTVDNKMFVLHFWLIFYDTVRVSTTRKSIV